MTREDVLKEFSRPYQSHEDVGGPDADAMADEIVRLRKEFDIATSMLGEQVPLLNRMQDENDRLRAILAALREPSMIMRDAVRDALNARDVTDPIIGEDIDEIIAAAVAAAENETTTIPPHA